MDEHTHTDALAQGPPRVRRHKMARLVSSLRRSRVTFHVAGHGAPPASALVQWAFGAEVTEYYVRAPQFSLQVRGV
jgi:hypothetical protein